MKWRSVKIVDINSKKCDYCGSNYKIRKYKNTNIYVCGKHYMQLERNGEIKRTKYDENKIKVYPKHSCAVVYIYNSIGKKIGKTFVSLCDLELIRKYKWCLGSRNHIVSCIDGHTTRLHRFIMKAKPNEIVKHLNKKVNDNRRENLIKEVRS